MGVKALAQYPAGRFRVRADHPKRLEANVEPVEKVGSPQVRPPLVDENHWKRALGGRGCAEPFGITEFFDNLVGEQ